MYLEYGHFLGFLTARIRLLNRLCMLNGGINLKVGGKIPHLD